MLCKKLKDANSKLKDAESLHNLHSINFVNRVYDSRDKGQQEEIQAISNAKNSVKILGISYKTFWGDQDRFHSVLIDAAKNRVKLSCLILDPNGNSLKLKANDEGDDPPSWQAEINTAITRFRDQKTNHKNFNFELFTYDIFPIWHMVIIDDRIGYIGFYPTGSPGFHAPMYVIEKKDEDNISMLIPFIKYFDILKSSGKKVI